MEDIALSAPQEAPTMSFIQRLSGIFFEPGKTFADIDRKPSWLGVFLLISLITIPFTYTLMGRIDTTTAMRQRMEAQGASPQQVEQQIRAAEMITGSPYYRYGIVAVAPVGNLIFYLAAAGVLLLVFVLMGAPLTYKKSLAVTFWGFFPAGIVGMILGTIIMLAKEPGTVDPQHLLMSNLGFLVDAKAHPALNSLLASFDLFSFWSIALLSIGFAAVSDRKLTTKKAATGLVVLWAIFVLGKMGYYAIFG